MAVSMNGVGNAAIVGGVAAAAYLGLRRLGYPLR